MILRETAERIQIYDKLCTSSLFAHEDRLFEFFTRFHVPLKDKRKKVMLSEVICKFRGVLLRSDLVVPLASDVVCAAPREQGRTSILPMNRPSS
jgi:hypothetical protein